MCASRWLSILLAVVLVVVFVVGFVLISAVVLVRGRLLDAGLYSDALVRTDAYERTYTEVLADPELAELTEDLLGGLDAGELDPTQVRALATGTLRLTVPPSTLREGTDTFIAAVLAYVRGDVPRLDADVDVTEVAERIDEAATTWVRSLAAGATDRVTGSAEDYRAAVAAYADQLAAGTVPDTIPVLGGTSFDPARVLDAILDQLGPDIDPRLREQIRAAVVSGDERDALIEATGELVAGRAAEAQAEVRASLEDRRVLDVVTELADRADRSKAAVVGTLDQVRDAAGWFGPRTVFAGGALMAGAAGGLVWSNRRRPRRAGVLLAVASVAAGLTLLVLWAMATRLVDAPLDPATEPGQDSWNLPPGLRSLLADIVASVGDELARTVRWLVLAPVAAGLALAAGIALAPRLRLLGLPRLPPPARAAAVATAAVLVAVAVWFVPGRVAGAEARACNGHAELCDRPYDEVTYAATHNSMSSPDVVYIWPEQDGDIRAQLDAGVRALLIDTHHWTPLVSDEQLTAADPYLPAGLAEQVFDRLERLGRLREERDGTFLCHNQCALGAIPLLDALTAVREFLDENPDEVVTLIVQDAITPAETAEAFTRAGLDPYLHTHGPGTQWATLGELIDRGERLVVFAEDEGPPPAWYQHAFDQIQDTPYRFEEPDDFTCTANRGDADATLFLMNHWVQRVAPDRATAAGVNRHDVIVERARECERERGLRPNYVAVDFYNIGDLTDAVDTLNGVG
jgi:hypothetical protein